MATHDKPIPTKLKHDAIVEALLEIRFDAATIPEIFFGRLADYGPWKGFRQSHLPTYNIPAPLRQADKDLRYQPVFELKDVSGRRAVRIGGHVLSYHRTAPYVGWNAFEPELHEAIEGLFAKTEGLMIRRLELRYLNALRPDVHGIRSISDLDLTLAIAHEDLVDRVNINFQRDLFEDTRCTIRIATKEFVRGALPVDTSIFVDVAVSTKGVFQTTEGAKAKDWVHFAHKKEKEQFFRLLTDETIDALKEY